jgi:hypothetical protein
VCSSHKRNSAKFADTTFACLSPQAVPQSLYVDATTTRPLHIDTNSTAESGERLRLATSELPENFSRIRPTRGAGAGLIGVSVEGATCVAEFLGHGRLGTICTEYIAGRCGRP